LNGYIDRSKYDYIGYRERYNELSKEEQTIFKKLGDVHQYIKEVVNAEISEVTPCNKIISKSAISILYSATI